MSLLRGYQNRHQANRIESLTDEVSMVDDQADPSPFASETVTRGIRVRVEPRFDPSRSEPARGQWFFLYSVIIRNESTGTVQLMSRHWIITDGLGQVEEVRGPGVVGEQPVLAPGNQFEYTSGCPLPTDVGTMHGSYQMVTSDGERFDADIAAFTLCAHDTVQ